LRRSTKYAAALTAGILSLALTACGGSDSEGSTKGAGDGSSAKSDLKVGLAYDIGGRGDQSFNDMAAAGLDKAKKEFGGESSESEAQADESDAAKEDRLTQLADAGYNPIIAVGFAYAPSLEKVAPQFPDTTFDIILSYEVSVVKLC
jgi:basic membrane protein A